MAHECPSEPGGSALLFGKHVQDTVLLSLPQGGERPILQMNHQGPGRLKALPRVSHLTLHTVQVRTLPTGAFQQFPQECGCIIMPPTGKNQPAYGKCILVQRGCRRGKSKISRRRHLI